MANSKLGVRGHGILEGSRFVALQLYRLAAGGSRERLDARQFYGPLYPHNQIDAMGKTSRWVIPGSRLFRRFQVAFTIRTSLAGP
ncbi:MAG TPA: hypothetical protein VN939_14685 [Chthoniobacterales bacterium]|jgi:hypothetical protein|nr:hypothetical protein [Chthoniobacterales bacterium]